MKALLQFVMDVLIGVMLGLVCVFVAIEAVGLVQSRLAGNVFAAGGVVVVGFFCLVSTACIGEWVRVKATCWLRDRKARKDKVAAQEPAAEARRERIET